jgi:bacteriorhodopsin
VINVSLENQLAGLSHSSGVDGETEGSLVHQIRDVVDGVVSVLAGFIPGMAGWLYIVYEIFFGECGAISGKVGSKAAQSAFNTLRLIVSVGWIIYPLGYYLVYLGPTFTYHSESVVNIVYNVADLVNKGAFGLAIYSAAMTEAR